MIVLSRKINNKISNFGARVTVVGACGLIFLLLFRPSIKHQHQPPATFFISNPFVMAATASDHSNLLLVSLSV
jgi:hypothetical protein